MTSVDMTQSPRRTAMTRAEMDALIEQHITTEMAGDYDAAVAVYTPDVVHDDVGSPTGPLHGPEAAKNFYTFLGATFTTERMEPTHTWYGENFCVMEHRATGTAIGDMLGIPGHGRRISFRMLHIWEFKDGAISLENTWLDDGAIVAQLTA